MSDQLTTGQPAPASVDSFRATPPEAQPSVPPPPVIQTTFGHRWWIPAVVLSLGALILAFPVIWQAIGLDDTNLMQMAMFSLMGSVLLTVLGLMVWWLILSRFDWRLLWGVALVVLLIGFGASPGAHLIRWESPGMTRGSLLYPRFSFFWQKTPEQRLEEHRAIQEQEAQARGITLPALNLRVEQTDFPRYRGRNADGVTTGPALADAWQTRSPNILWNRPAGGGYAGVAVAGNAVITVEQRGDREVVVCYDRNSGRERWTSAYPACHKDAMGDGPRATPTIDGGDVFSLGANGDLVCLDGADGKARWQVNVLTDSHATKVQWGLSGSPLVLADRVIVNAGINPDNNTGEALAAYDRKTGQRLWAAGKHGAGYSSPQLSTLDGVEQILLFDAGGLAGFDPANGTELWRHPWSTFNEMNTIQPLVVGSDRVFISSELKNGCALLRVQRSPDGQGWKPEVVWQNRNLCTKYANPVYAAGHLYGLRDGWLVCLEAANGETCWRGQRYGMGQLLVAGDKLIVITDQGEVVLVALDPYAARELGRFEVLKYKTWNTPALAGNQLFLRNEQDMACVELPVSK